MSLARLMQLVLRHVLVILVVGPLAAVPALAQNRPSIVHKVRSPNERMEMTVNTSRILTLDQKIPQAQVNNPELLDLHPLSPNEIQLFAKTPGVTQVNLWGENQQIYTIDVIVYGDAQALTTTLQLLFPNASIKVLPVANGVILSGFVDQPENVSRIIEIAQEYYPKVLNNMKVAGVQEVLLHVKVMEVSRTKLRQLGFDFAKATNGTIVYSGIAGLLTAANPSGATANLGTFGVSTVEGASSFMGVLNAMRQDNLTKILAEPTLVTVSGRPAMFQVGGEFPILVPQSLGTSSVDFKKYGTQVDFVPIVLGNGRIRLEVRPRVSEIDESRNVTVGSSSVPGLRVREVETGVEMTAGQTLAIAGLVQTRVEAENLGLPFISEIPYLGAAFRRVREQRNEVELLILVTPEFTEARDPQDMPPCGPGMNTTSPSDCELYLKGHLEVPKCCPNNACAGNPTMDGSTSPAGMPSDATTVPTPAATDRPGSNMVPQSMPGKTDAEVAPLPASTGRAAVGTSGVRMAARTSSSPQNRYTSPSPRQQPGASNSQRPDGEPNFIGPTGYEVK